MNAEIRQESIMVPAGRENQLHLCRLTRAASAPGAPVLLVHGCAEDGRVFWSDDGRGLGPYLARAGYSVFIADLRGRGRSWPAVSPQSRFGFHEIVTEDLPALRQAIARRCPEQGQTWIGHGSGGALLVAALLRGDSGQAPVTQLVHFGVRRQLCHRGLRRRILFDLLWHRCGRLGVAMKGYFPARALRLGARDESAGCFFDGLDWATEEAWRDSSDGFDYAEVSRELPRSLYFACAQEQTWSHPDDVRRFMQSLGPHNARLITLGSELGNQHDYDHLGMLLHPDAETDHFPQLLSWLQGQ